MTSSSHSYPSPISSSAPSPQLNTTPIDPPAPIGTYRVRQTQAGRPPTPPEDIDVVAASVRARLAQVRNDLLDLSNGLQEPVPQLRARGEVGPTHDAIMLTGELSQEAPTSETTSSNMSTQELIDAYDYSFRRVVQAQSSLALMAEQASYLRQSIDHIPTPPIEPPAPGRLRHQPLPLQSPPTLAPSLTDDGFTTMGRRVAAREQAAQQRRALARIDTLPADELLDAPRTNQFPANSALGELQPDDRFAMREAELEALQHRQLRREAELQAIQTRRLRQQVELQSAEAMRLRQELADLQRQSSEARRLTQVQNQLASPTSPVLSRQEPRRRRLMRTDTRPSSTGSRSSGSGTGTGTGSTLSSEQSRLSILSGSLYDIQNFSSPASAAPSVLPGMRPLIFEEPENWVESPRGTIDNDIMVDEVTSGRNYLVRRRITPEGTERVQNIPFPPPTEADLWELYAPRSEPPSDLEVARRRAMLQTFHDRTSRVPSTIPFSNMPTSRRRGWAYLDPNGNETPVDQGEVDFERNRPELRLLRVRDALGGASPLDSDGEPGPAYQSLRGPVEGIVVDSEANDTTYRSGIHRRRRRPGHLEDKSKNMGRRSDPLPMALDEMVTLSKRPRLVDEDTTVVVGSWASFAGR